MRQSIIRAGAAFAAAALAFAAGEPKAAACGGCFVKPNENDSIITDHRMILSVSPQQTTLYDQIEYQGSPSSFAWVLPTRGTVTIGLSADVLFGALDTLTRSQVVPPPQNCPPPPTCGNFGAGASVPQAAAADAGANDGVTVLKHENVGPYETVQLAATDPAGLNHWLAQHGYNVPPSAQAIVDQYVNEKFDFLALKLIPGQGVEAMRPVRVSTQGASAVLPLRMVTAGTGATVGITLWVISDGRYEPQNFPFFHITDDEIVWDWAANQSNYATLRTQKEAALGGRGWEVESSLSIYQQNLTSIVNNGGFVYGPGGGPGSPNGGIDAGPDYLPASDADGGTESADQVRSDDLATLFAGIAGPNARITRLSGNLAHSALSADLVLQASVDQSILTNIHQVTHEVNEPQCPIYNNDCSVVGYGPRDQVSGANSFSAGGGGGGGGRGCETAPRSQVGDSLVFGALASLLGLTVLRARRRRST